MRLTLETPPHFSLPCTVLSHGWCSLPPFEPGEAGRSLGGVVSLPGGGAQPFRISSRAGRIVVDAPGSGDAVRRAALRVAARRMLNLDLDLSLFYTHLRRHESLSWVVDAGAGRLLRSPSLWEDLVKLVLTTNCSWAFTKKMARALVELYGEPAPCGARAFPRPESLAAVGEKALRDRVRAGYRAPLLARLAREVAEGRVDPDGWERDSRDPAELRAEMLKLPGVGPYVAENLLKLLGRPRGLALDSWLRSRYAEVYHGGRRVTDRTIARRYAHLGDWAGLGLWCDMTRDGLEAVYVE